MSLIYDLQQLQSAAMRMESKAILRQTAFNRIVSGLVGWRQECRLSKDYATADRIRSLLEGVGIEIVAGAAGLPPEQWGNRQSDDTWSIK